MFEQDHEITVAIIEAAAEVLSWKWEAEKAGHLEVQAAAIKLLTALFERETARVCESTSD